MKRSRLPRYVTRFTDRHGRPRWRFRRKGQATHYFRARFGTPEFEAEYDACLRGEAAPRIEPGKGRIAAGTVADLVRRYFGSPEFLDLKASTKATYRRQLERFVRENGGKRVRSLQRKHVKAIIGSMRDRPGAANSLLTRLKILMRFAVEEGMRRDNPAAGVRGYRTRSEGFHAWSEAEIEAFEQRHPIGTKAHLAFALMLYTGQRRSDVVRMGRQHVDGRRILVIQQKTGRALSLPLHPELAHALKLAPGGDLTFLLTEYGRPFSPAGFGNWFRARCDEAGLPQCSAHGLRKAAARRLAEAGATPSEIGAITGHETLKEVSRYTRSVDQSRLADKAMGHLRRRKSGTSVANRRAGSQKRGEK